MVTRLTLKQASVPLRRIDARNSLDALHQRGRGRERERRASYRTRTPSDIHAVSSRTRGCWKTGVGWLSAAPSAIEGFHNDTGGAKLRDRAAGENANEIKLPRSGRINLPIVSMKLTRERERAAPRSEANLSNGETIRLLSSAKSCSTRANIYTRRYLLLSEGCRDSKRKRGNERNYDPSYPFDLLERNKAVEKHRS